MSARGTRHFNIRNFSKGLVLIRPSITLESGEAVEAENVVLDQNTVKRRPGWTKIHTNDLDPHPVTSLYPHYVKGQPDRLFATVGGSLLFSEGGDFTLSSNSLAPQGPIRAQFESTQGRLYIATKYGPSEIAQSLKKWTQAGGVENVSSPAGSILTTYSDVLFLSGSDLNPDRVFWSKPFPNQESWPATNFLDVFGGDGDRVTGFGRLLNALIVFKERSIHRITGTPPEDAAVETGDLSVFSYEDQAGCIAPRSVASGYNQIIYLNRQGVFSYDGVQAKELTQDIRPIFETLNESELKNAVGMWAAPYHYILSVTRDNSLVPNLIISIHLRPKSIVLWTNLPAYSMAQFRFSGETSIIFGFTGEVGKQGGNTDNGEAISWKYTTGAVSLGDEPLHKYIRRVWLWANPVSGDAAVEMLPDFSGKGTKYILPMGKNMTAGEREQRLRAGAFGLGRHWQLRLSGRSTGNPPEISEIQIEYFPKNRL